MRYWLAIVLVALVAACESAAAPPASPAPAAPTTATASATPAPAAKTTCLMTHICGCNLGCARVDAANVHEGSKVTAQTGPYAGKELMVLKETDAAGAGVLTLSDRERNMPCEAPRESKSLMGFACAAKDSGPVPVNACAKGCD